MLSSILHILNEIIFLFKFQYIPQTIKNSFILFLGISAINSYFFMHNGNQLQFIPIMNILLKKRNQISWGYEILNSHWGSWPTPFCVQFIQYHCIQCHHLLLNHENYLHILFKHSNSSNHDPSVFRFKPWE